MLSRISALQTRCRQSHGIGRSGATFRVLRGLKNRMSIRTIGRLIERAGVSYTLLCCLVFGELCGREFAALDVACVDLRKLLPLLGQATVDALGGIDVELRDFIEAGTAIIVGCALLGVDAIYGASIGAGGVLSPRCRARQ
jgi:hypothetical protein